MSNPPPITHAKEHPLSGPSAVRFVDNTVRQVANINADLGSPIDVNSTDDPAIIPDDGYIHQDPGGSFDRSQYYADRQLTLTLAGGGSAVVVSLYVDGDNTVVAKEIALTTAAPVTIEPPGDQITRITTDVAPVTAVTIDAGDTLCSGCRGVTLPVGGSITVRLAKENVADTSVTAAKPITLPAGDNFRNIVQVPVGGISQSGAQLFW